MKEKKVLIIAYYFPPLGMGGVQRVTKFAKYLPLFGWKPYVLTIKEVEYFAKDYSLLEYIPREVETIRTGSFDPLRVWSILRNILKKGKRKDKPVKAYPSRRSKLFSWLFFPDNKVGWIPFALMNGLKLCRKEKFDLIFSSSPPPSLHLTGYLLKRFTGIPWIADFRDPWTGYKFENFPTPFHLFLKKRMERFIINKADKVITANPAITRDFENRLSHPQKICLIHQGYDEEDFQKVLFSPSEIFTIGYLGTLSPDCDPEPFFAALGELIGEGIISKDKIRFVHVGLSMGIDLDNLIEKYKLKEVVQEKGYLSHPDSLKEMANVSLLLLVTSDHPLIFPAKVFEYLRLKKPILGILPPKSQIAEFLIEMKAGIVVSPKDEDGIKQGLLLYFKNFTEGKITSDINEEWINKFERKSITLKLTSLFDEVVQRWR
jgi:glycosyltransferase involved in cell wall biosynthesis